MKVIMLFAHVLQVNVFSREVLPTHPGSDGYLPVLKTRPAEVLYVSDN